MNANSNSQLVIGGSGKLCIFAVTLYNVHTLYSNKRKYLMSLMITLVEIKFLLKS